MKLFSEVVKQNHCIQFKTFANQRKEVNERERESALIMRK